MKNIQVSVMVDASELVHYDSPSIPIYVKRGFLSYYPEKKAVCHWHDDFEIIYVLDGEMDYFINGNIVTLKKGDGLFINSREMHYGYSDSGLDCEFICILFSPSLLSSCKELYEKYVTPVFSPDTFSYIMLDSVRHAYTIELINKIYNKNKASDPFYELEIIGLLHLFSVSILRICKEHDSLISKPMSDDILLLRNMVSYIHKNYKNSICLNDIAASANICKSKCCSLFQSQINMTPFEFLNYYRLEKSTELLKENKLPITSIATNCGFNNSSYYSKLFFRFYHCTPREYRKSFISF